jgi:hypothetical protein
VLVLALPRRARRPQHRQAADENEPPNARVVHRVKQMTGRIDRVPLMGGEISGRLGGGVDDDVRTVERCRRHALAQVRGDPFMNVGVVDSR